MRVVPTLSLYVNIVTGLYIAKAPMTSGINLAGSNAATPLGYFRL
jgi:hypothetical protein